MVKKRCKSETSAADLINKLGYEQKIAVASKVKKCLETMKNAQIEPPDAAELNRIWVDAISVVVMETRCPEYRDDGKLEPYEPFRKYDAYITPKEF